MVSTKAFKDEHKGHPTLVIKKVDDDGEPQAGGYPVVAFGLVKAKAILKHIDDIKKFVEDGK